MTRIPKNPCKDCTERYPACSAKCEKSDEWHEAYYARKAEVKADADARDIAEYDMNGYKFRKK